LSDERQRAQALLAYLESRREAMVEALVELASIESPTDVPETQAAVQRRLADSLERCGLSVRRIRGRRTADHLYARPLGRAKGRPAQLLIGHSDTVWPVGTLETMPVCVKNGHVRGPGTFDMKAGLVQGVFALEALRALALEPPATPVWLINSDEEIGSPDSKRWVRLLARTVVRTFVLEPAFGPDGHLKTARKGVTRFRVTVRGMPAHAGLDPTAGASAIAELAYVIQKLHALTDLERGTTVNVGTVRGGTRPNVIAAEASAEVDVRVRTVAAGEEISRRIHGLEPETAGTSIHVETSVGIPPLERTGRNRALWAEARAAGERLGLELGDVEAGGGSDGNTTSQFTATLDGLGAIGDGAHAAHEAVSIDGMVERSALLAELLMLPLPRFG
jgi:glutamate carboxypeptidase